ncbi:MAG: hypothetical protein V4443_01055 [Pseudomonadota bacterium]
MKTIKAFAVATLFVVSLPAHAQTPMIHLNVGGQISPGVYGQVELGNMPPPPVFYPQPVVIQQRPNVVLAPIYLHVPPGHAKHWRKHCREYNACNRPVYFVRSEEYEPNYHRHDERRHGKHGDEFRGEGHREGHRD